MHALLLAASWHQKLRNFAPLEILSIGQLPSHLKYFFSNLGIHIKEISPNINDTFSKTANTIEGAIPIPGEQILLVDNDVYFHGDIRPLADLPKNSFYGCPSGNLRVTEKHWNLIIDNLGLRPIENPFVPNNVQLKVLKNPDTVPTVQPYAYTNGGVILIPANCDQHSTWQDHQEKIYNFFKNHPLGCGSVTKSNMAALATSIGSYGAFSWLPHGYNYRPDCFALGLCDISDIRIVHMTGDVKSVKASTLKQMIQQWWNAKTVTKSTLKQRIQHWRNAKIDTKFEDLENYVGFEEKERRWRIFCQVFDAMISVIDNYDLETLVACVDD